MFGNNDSSQSQSGPITSPSYGGQAAQTTNDKPSVFPPKSASTNDPFGTTPASASPTAQPTDSGLFDDQADEAGAHENPTESPASTSHGASAGDHGLIDIKQEALQQLSPLVGHLDQTAEEKFKTTMMMIQATDNKDLVPTAFEAAKAIEDDKIRAQALLDIINEINYFTQSHHIQ